ncbi:hypothetical protein [Silvanigrella aquatica]|uniref:Uncharacterized protein n=1 Tax=Silvanigrella aquatica TaxID=1915309 RepID=A0A1L4CYR7_9BACT|nr:hypothetical protein [Silvanigrella aquatica]APJ03096.1 hypothetical protein AXG55_03910 [Silvanigrella aquatica]
MKYKLILFMLFALPNILLNISIYSLDKTYIICVDTKRNWYWLQDNNKKYVEVNGIWNKWDSIKENPRAVYNFKFSYFLINEEQNFISKTIQMCKRNFGREYFIVQPANYSISNWSLFAINTDLFIGGFVDVLKNVKTKNNGYNKHLYSQKSLYFLGNDKMTNFLNSNIVYDLIFKNFY